MMAVTLLHVEDDEIQREFLAHQLSEMGEFEFAIRCAESEDQAIEEVCTGGVQIVVLDYNLSEGNGLSCLRKLRRVDSLMPIIAISGVATSQIAVELINAGADGFISKASFRVDEFQGMIRDSLQRAKAMRQRLFAHHSATNLSREFPKLCRAYIEAVGPTIGQKLDDLVETAKEAKLNAEDIEELFTSMASTLDQSRLSGESDCERALGPLKWEFLRRLQLA